jgi:hypothetical protein
MRREKKKKKTIKERNYVVPLMILNCKPGAHIDKKKEMNRKACRGKLGPVDGYPSAPFSIEQLQERSLHLVCT